MGEASETTMTMTMTMMNNNNNPPKKKKGRPSLLDLQKRFLQQQLQQSQQQNQNPHFRHPRRNPNAAGSPPRPHDDDDDDDDDERAKKKHKLLLGINHQNQRKPTLPPRNSDSNADDDDPAKITAVRRGSNHTILKATDSSGIHGTQVEFGPTTPLPDKKLLVFILDRLQKKDTRGVFSEPVDPEELPDYHEIIENPMDFGTVREKLDKGAYANLEQFEKDVLLISSNAMQYNAPDTIYFRQARSIQELAKKDFENLRQDNTGDGGGEIQPKVVPRRGRPPGSKTMKKSLDMAPVERLGSQYFSETSAPGGENSSLSNSYNLRKAPTSYKFRTAEALNRSTHGSLGGDTSANWLAELENEFPASVLRSVLRYGKKQFPVDENRRHTYKQSLASEHEPAAFTGLEGEWNHLLPVGVAADEHGYARSLARFAANLGPVAWKIARKRIGSVLTPGVEFGPGWVGENELSRSQQFSFREGEDRVHAPASDDHKDRLRCQSTSGLSSVADRYSLQNGVNMENCREINPQNGLVSFNNAVSGIRPVPSTQNSMTHSGMSSLTNSSVPYHQMVGMFPERSMNTQSMPIGNIDSNETKSESSSRSRNPLARTQPQPHSAYGGETSWKGLSMNNKQVSYSLPPDLNIEFGAPGSPSSLIQIGMKQQPDLALQL